MISLKITIDKISRWAKNHVSAVFIMMLLASFVLWYIAKLNYDYTTELDMHLHVDGRDVNIDGREVDIEDQTIDVSCLINGRGYNLFWHNTQLRVPLSKLKFRVTTDDQMRRFAIVDRQSLQEAIAAQCSDITVQSITDSIIPSIPVVKKNQ